VEKRKCKESSSPLCFALEPEAPPKGIASVWTLQEGKKRVVLFVILMVLLLASKGSGLEFFFAVLTHSRKKIGMTSRHHQPSTKGLWAKP
jgi:hypothetical protein